LSALSSQDVQSIYGLLNAASGKDATKLLYRTLNLPKHAAEAVYNIEAISTLLDTLPEGLKKTITELMNVHQKALMATTSVNAKTMEMLTINRQRIEVNNPAARKNFVQKLIGGGQQQEG
jgi:hypothetical protein